MILENFKPFIGGHCETTALGNLLQHAGVAISEPMIFGLGQGLGFIYWDMKAMDFPFIGGRAKPDAITRTFCQSVNIPVKFTRTTSVQKAWKNIEQALEAKQPVGLKLDCYYLDYFTQKIHFAAHYAALYGYDQTHAFLSDTNQQGPLGKTTLASLSAARRAKGPMASPNLTFQLAPPVILPALGPVIQQAVRENAAAFLTPPIKNIGYAGIFKTSRQIRTWLKRSSKPATDLTLCALLMEKGGTGGSLFRKMYSAFLQEAYEITGKKEYQAAAAAYRDIAASWTQVARLIEQAGKFLKQDYLEEASRLLAEIGEREKACMQTLSH